MNGEMLQAAADVIAIECCRKSGTILPAAEENAPSREFQFLDGRHTCEYEKWVKWVNDDGIRKMILYPNMPKIVERRKTLGFSGAFLTIMPAFHANGEMTFWQNMWEYLKEENRWKITTKESAWENGPAELIAFPGKPELEALTQSLKAAVDLCEKIGAPEWKNVFLKSLLILREEKYDLTGEDIQSYFHKYNGVLPKDNLRIFAASGNAFVFGAMGSWNDAPSGLAEKSGLQKEYDNISEMLLFGCVANLTYAVNNW